MRSVARFLRLLPLLGLVGLAGVKRNGTEVPRCFEEVEKLLEGTRFTEAIDAARRCLEETERAYGPESLATALALDRLVDGLHRQRKSPDEARSLAERSLRIKEHVRGPDHVDTATSLRLLAVMLRERTPKDAKPLLERARVIEERATPRDTLELAKTLLELGACEVELDLPDSAFAHYTYARTLLAPRRPADTIALARAIAGQGRARRVLGDFDAAAVFCREAVDVVEADRGRDDPAVGTFVAQLAQVLRSAGRYGEAQPLYHRAVLDLEKSLGPDHPSVAGALSNLALLDRLLGDRATARALYERALRIRENALGPDHQEVAITLGNLAQVLLELDEPAIARADFERALAICRRVYGPDHSSLLPSLRALAKLDRQEGHIDSAEVRLREALRILERPGAPAIDRVRTLRSLAALELAKEAPRAAGPLYEEAQRASEETLGPLHPDRALTLDGLGATAWALGDPRAAVDRLLAAQAIRRDHFRLNARSVSGRNALSFAQRSGRTDTVVSVLAAALATDGPTIERVWDAVVRSRAIVLDELAARHRALLAVDDPAVRAALDSAEVAQRAVLALVMEGRRGRAEAEHDRRLEAALRRNETCERRLAETSAFFRWLHDQTTMGFDDVVHALPPRAALVAYVRYAGIERPESVIYDAGDRPRERYAAFVLGVDRAPRFIPIGDEDAVQAAVDVWQDALQPEAVVGSHEPSPRVEAELRRRGEALRQLLWDPIAPRLDEADLVFLVPDGLLQLVSFAALPAGEGYLVERGPSLHFLTAERDLVAQGGSAGRGLLAMGSPDFDSASLASARLDAPPVRRASTRVEPAPGSGCQDLADLRFGALRSAAHELRNVEAAWNRAANTEPARVVAGRDASEAAFRRFAPGARVLHLATHAFLLDHACDPVREPDDLDADDTLVAAPREDPLLLSGLALGGANVRDASTSTTDDGILTAEEVSTLDLRGVRCAVLSACNTGLGTPESSEGFVGLKRAFEIAGVETLVASLWAIDDAATAEWMNAFYDERLGKGRTVDRAVREASLRVLRARREKGWSTHPYYWAGFVASGGWR